MLSSGYVGALAAADDVLAVALDTTELGSGSESPNRVELFDGAGKLTSNAIPLRTLTYPGVNEGWCGYAITTVKYANGLLFSGGWGYLAIEQNALGAPTRTVIDPCEPHDSAHSSPPPVYLRLEPLYP